MREVLLELLARLGKLGLNPRDAVGCTIAILVEDHYPVGHVTDAAIFESYETVVSKLLPAIGDHMMEAGFPAREIAARAIQERRTVGELVKVAARLAIKWSAGAFEERDQPTQYQKLLIHVAYKFLTPRLSRAQWDAAARQAKTLLSQKIKAECGRPGLIQEDDITAAVLARLAENKPVGFLAVGVNRKPRIEAMAFSSAVSKRQTFASAGHKSGDAKIKVPEKTKSTSLLELAAARGSREVSDLIRETWEHLSLERAEREGHSKLTIEAALECKFLDVPQEEAAKKYGVDRNDVRRAIKWIKEEFNRTRSA